MLPHLSFDIQEEIVKKLPIKSLIQFRSVCKAWKSLIDGAEFIASHDLAQHLVVNYAVGYGEEREVKYVSFVDDDTFPQQKVALTVPPLIQKTRIIGSSHGLLCFAGYLEETDDSSRTQTAVIWNPAIRKSIDVVVPDVIHRPPFNHVFGFGVCPDTKDPKLVKIKYIDDYREMESISSIPCQVMVFTLSSGEWTTSSCTNLPSRSIKFTWSQTVIGQFIYLVAQDWIAVDGGIHNLIVSFDMGSEEFREIDLPDYLAELLEPYFSVYRLRESLAVVEYDTADFPNRRVCHVWMMDHGDSKAFTKLFTINLPNTSIWSTLGFRKSGEPIVEILDDNAYDCALVVYEPWSKHIKDLGIRGNDLSFFATSYTESLLLLNHDNGHIVKCGAAKR